MVRTVDNFLRRLARSTVVWSWVLNGLRACSTVILLPLMFRELGKSDLGMSGVLSSLASLSLIASFGFGPTIDRFVSYAMGGAKALKALGVPQPGGSHQPNYDLLWELLATTRQLTWYITLILFVVLGIGGTVMVEHLIRAERTLHPDFALLMPRLAWAATFLSTLFDIHSNWWALYLRGLNEVRAATKVAALAAAVKLVIAGGLLLAGAGLLSLPISTMVASFIQRRYARAVCLKLLPAPPPVSPSTVRQHLATMWPNSWRLGLQWTSTFLIAQFNTLVCAHVYHLAASAQYTYSVQLMSYAAMMASVWTSIKWPLVGQYQARHDHAMIRRVLWPRVWLQTVTFLILGACVVFVAPDFLYWIGDGKELLPLPWLLCLMLGGFMDMQMSTCGTLIATGNRLPFIWPSIIANVASMILSLALLRFTLLGPGAFVLGPILANAVFNYWYWPSFAARGMKTTLFRFLFLGPDKSAHHASAAPASRPQFDG